MDKRSVLLDGVLITGWELIDFAIAKGWEPGPVRFTSMAARYLRSLGYDVREGRLDLKKQEPAT